jgi:hypothetical protein
LSGTTVLTQVELIVSGLLLVAFQAKGNLVAGKKLISHAAFCVYILNSAEFVAFKDAGVVSHKSCCRGSVGVLSLVTVYGRLSSNTVQVDNATTVFLPSVLGVHVVKALLDTANPCSRLEPSRCSAKCEAAGISFK